RLSFEESHAVTRQVQEAVRTVSPLADVVVRAVPTGENEGILETIQAVAAREHLAIHNISTHLTSSGMWIDLDLEVDPDISFERAHSIASGLEARLSDELGQTNDPARPHVIADINVHIEPRAVELAAGRELKAASTSPYVQGIRSVASQLPHVHAFRDVNVQQLNGKVYLALHLVIDADQSIAQVHSISEEVENRLRREFPELGRVVIHAEPYKEVSLGSGERGT
ncbi:MAG: hypothetical protein M1482_17795, partial [Chloroflexi bacterium]|nr:hypothetical protein [Chloroflexota bacterium]